MSTSVPPPGWVESPRALPGAPRAPHIPVDPLREESRRGLDGRRVGAAIVDSLLGVPFGIFFATQFGDNFGTVVLTLAIVLIYHHLCELIAGQTLGKSIFGLRVAMWDGRHPKQASAAARNVLRLFEMPVIAPIVMICSGKRRQRIGDVIAGTIVIDARKHPAPPPQWRGAFLVYPVLWLAPAVVVFALATQEKVPGTYTYEMDNVCRQARERAANSAYRRNVGAQLAMLAYEVQLLARMEVPEDAAVRHRILIERRRAQLETAYALATRMTLRPNHARQDVHRWSVELQPLIARDRTALEELGFHACAGPDVL